MASAESECVGGTPGSNLSKAVGLVQARVGRGARPASWVRAGASRGRRPVWPPQPAGLRTRHRPPRPAPVQASVSRTCWSLRGLRAVCRGGSFGGVGVGFTASPLLLAFAGSGERTPGLMSGTGVPPCRQPKGSVLARGGREQGHPELWAHSASAAGAAWTPSVLQQLPGPVPSRPLWCCPRAYSPTLHAALGAWGVALHSRFLQAGAQRGCVAC